LGQTAAHFIGSNEHVSNTAWLINTIIDKARSSEATTVAATIPDEIKIPITSLAEYDHQMKESVKQIVVNDLSHSLLLSVTHVTFFTQLT